MASVSLQIWSDIHYPVFTVYPESKNCPLYTYTDCPWLGTLKNVEAHLKICVNRLILCPQKCSESVPRSSMATHISQDCPETMVNCEFYDSQGFIQWGGGGGKLPPQIPQLPPKKREKERGERHK